MRANLQSSNKKQEISNFHVSKSNIHDSDAAAYDHVKAEKALWAAVITQALMDAGSESRKPEARHEKAKAIRWLLGNSEDFITVCQNAELDPQYVRSKAKAAIERGCVWRRGMAEKRRPTEANSPDGRKYYVPTAPLNQPSRPQAIPPYSSPMFPRHPIAFSLTTTCIPLRNHR